MKLNEITLKKNINNYLFKIAITLYIISSLIYVYFSKDIMIGVEYRQWVFGNVSFFDLTGNLFNFFKNSFDYNIYTARNTSFLTASFIRFFCLNSIQCHNYFNVGLLTLSGLGIFLILCILGSAKNYLFNAILGLIYLISIPALSGYAWQATLLDRTSVFFAMVVILFVITTQNNIKNNIQIFLFNLILTILVIFAYQTKEANYSLIICITYYIYIQHTGYSFPAKVEHIFRMVGFPALVALYLAIKNTYNIFIEGSYIEHASGGNKLDNFLTLFGYASNWNSNLFLTYYTLLFLITIILIRKSPKGNAYVYWALISFFFSLVIPAGTKFAADFYVITPSAYWVIFIGLLLQNNNIYLFKENIIIKNTIIIYASRACYLLCALYALWGFQYVYRASSNVTNSFRDIESANLESSQLSIFYPKGIFFAYKFYEQGKIDWLFIDQESGVLDKAKFIAYDKDNINFNGLTAKDYVLDWDLNIIPR